MEVVIKFTENYQEFSPKIIKKNTNSKKKNRFYQEKKVIGLKIKVKVRKRKIKLGEKY